MNGANLTQALFTRLSNYTALTARLGAGGISEKHPQDADSGANVHPYITFSFPSSRPWDTKTSTGANTLVDIHVWDRTEDNLSRRATAQEVYNALHRYDLPITSAATVNCLWENTIELADPDGITHHTAISFRVIQDEI